MKNFYFLVRPIKQLKNGFQKIKKNIKMKILVHMMNKLTQQYLLKMNNLYFHVLKIKK